MYDSVTGKFKTLVGKQNLDYWSVMVKDFVESFPDEDLQLAHIFVTRDILGSSDEEVFEMFNDLEFRKKIELEIKTQKDKYSFYKENPPFVEPQLAPMAWHPVTGLHTPYPADAETFRDYYPDVAWVYNPWLGKERHEISITLDPQGRLIRIEGETA